ncbi:hypothetical protein [Neisseria animaloris]|uniref:hypothetical protein n=1 Tax=Neisseria animaloris TaxID=326522 RepID=UPI000D2FA185|nr:hypothetical protein [Neisseria animaloris]
MKNTHGYNKHINLVEVLPEFLSSGIKQAKLLKCGIRIIGKLSPIFLNSEETTTPIDIDFSDLKKYPELPYLSIENDFKIKKIYNLETLYSLDHLETLCLEQAFEIDISLIKSLKDIRFNYSKKIKNIGNSINLERLHIWSYKAEDLKEFHKLINLKDILLVRPTIKSLNGMEKMLNLEKIDISYARNLEDISALELLCSQHKVDQIILPSKFQVK